MNDDKPYVRMEFIQIRRDFCDERPELKAQIEFMAQEKLRDFFERESATPLGAIDVSWEDIEVTWYESDDEDGEPIPYFEPYWVSRCRAEQAFLPSEAGQ